MNNMNNIQYIIIIYFSRQQFEWQGANNIWTTYVYHWIFLSLNSLYLRIKSRFYVAFNNFSGQTPEQFVESIGVVLGLKSPPTYGLGHTLDQAKQIVWRGTPPLYDL